MDICPVCGVETVIAAVSRRAERDGERVRVYEVQELRCRNPQCKNHGKAVGERKHLLFDGIPDGK